MLNCINGFYKPRSGSITFKGRRLPAMNPHFAAANGVARTFQNIALFRGMSTLDNLLPGRGLKRNRGLLWQAPYWGPAGGGEMAHRADVDQVTDVTQSPGRRWNQVGRPPLGLKMGAASSREPP